MEPKTCTRCSHRWLPRLMDREPARCPSCNSPYWNKPRRIIEQVPISERIEKKSVFSSLLREKGISAEQASMITGKSITTIYKYGKAAGLNVPADVLEKLRAIEVSLNTDRQFSCAISSCGHTWTARSAVPPVACPKCHNKHWLSGLSPVEAKGALKRMINVVPGVFQDFCDAVEVPAEKLLPYMRGKAMTKAQLDRLNAMLRSKGYDFRYLD